MSCVSPEKNRGIPVQSKESVFVPCNPENAFPEPEFPVLNSSGIIPGGSGKLS
jgi:hypothetical protein